MSTLRMTLAAGLTALSTVFAPLGAQAQETTPTNAAAGIPAERQVVTAEEALELSRPSCDTCPGRVVLHVGEGYRERTLRGDVQWLLQNDIEPVVVYGYQNQGVAAYVSGNRVSDATGRPVSFDGAGMAQFLADVIHRSQEGTINIARNNNNTEPSL
ncbi:MAG: hypothetical protein ACK4VI_04320 [Alphaproteobacteria bacterium]